MTKKAKELGDSYIAFDGYEPNGLTKREYYAGLAMHGILSNGEELKRLRDYISNHKRFSVDQLVAESGVYYADALLDELSKI